MPTQLKPAILEIAVNAEDPNLPAGVTSALATFAIGFMEKHKKPVIWLGFQRDGAYENLLESSDKNRVFFVSTNQTSERLDAMENFLPIRMVSTSSCVIIDDHRPDVQARLLKNIETWSGLPMLVVLGRKIAQRKEAPQPEPKRPIYYEVSVFTDSGIKRQCSLHDTLKDAETAYHLTVISSGPGDQVAIEELGCDERGIPFRNLIKYETDGIAHNG